MTTTTTMTTMTTMRRLALLTAGGSAAALLAMVLVAITTGATQEAYEYVTDPVAYAASLRAHAAGVRLVFALDVAFVVFYTAFFAALAQLLRDEHRRPFTHLALGALLVTAALDLVEDHHILSLLGAAEHGATLDLGSLVFQQTLSSTKFSISYISLFLFGLAIPRTTKLAWTLSLFLTAGTLVTGVAGYAVPPGWRVHLDSGRWIGFLVGFALAALWLRQAPERPSQPR